MVRLVRSGERGPEKVPMINAPAYVLVLPVLIIVTHALRMVVPRSWNTAVMFDGSLIPERFFETIPGAAYDGWAAWVFPFLANGFLHIDWGHALSNAMWIFLAGAILSKRLGSGRAAAMAYAFIYILATVGGALVFLWSQYPDGASAVGASAGAFGLMAATLIVMFVDKGRTNDAGGRAGLPVLPLILIGGFIIWNAGIQSAGIAWQGHLGGAAFGALAYLIVRWWASRGRYES